MSEEILRALMQLFALLTKQDGGVEEKEENYVRNFLKSQLGETGTDAYFELFREAAGLNDPAPSREKRRTSVLDSVRILGICRKINKTLNQSQKVVVLVRLFELVGSDKKLTAQRLSIIKTVSDVFRLREEEFESIHLFVMAKKEREAALNPGILCLHSQKIYDETGSELMPVEGGDLCFLRIPDLNLYFLSYTGKEDLYLNGLSLHAHRVYIFTRGSTIRLPHGKPLYYSDISSYFLDTKSPQELFYEAKNISYRFKNQSFGFKDISFNARHGNLVGIMGSSGSGKTTLLNVLSGMFPPATGSVNLNGIPVNSEEIRGSIGYVPEDDALFEELTVFENLYYNTKLCFRDLPEAEIRRKTEINLERLGLTAQKDLKVGSPLNKMISGGQRKRLNIALELVREPSVLLVDEPTSGLSSRDSENVMDLLRELTLSGKLIFVVIHQPSSELFKMFDKIIFLDEGGYMVYFGNPIEAVIHFKTLDDQINSREGECPTCGNVNPELIFNILEARVVDEYGNYTRKRKISPHRWKEVFDSTKEIPAGKEIPDKPRTNLQLPGILKQLSIFIRRDLRSKLGNHQYLALTLLEAPVLGFILAYIIRYIADPASNTYIFRENENIPIYIFMTMIVATFLGLTISAEEIFRDGKILKREKFLKLSRSGYLLSKVFILFAISAIQAALFVILANSIIELKNMNFAYWFAFFTTAACANLLGLNISSTFNSAVTIYIVIPLLIIPMMVLSGAMFSFDKLNRNISRIDKVPLLAEFMPTRWSYEALMVNQFKNNDFQVNFYEMDKKISNSDFKLSYYLPELESRLRRIRSELKTNSSLSEQTHNLRLLENELRLEARMIPGLEVPGSDFFDNATFSIEKAEEIEDILENLRLHYLEIFTRENKHKSNTVKNLLKNLRNTYYSYLDDYHNESVSDHVRKIYEPKKIVEYNTHLIRMIDPVYSDPVPEHLLNFRTHFFAPRKYFLGRYFDTYTFNMMVIWVICLLLYVSLYFDWLKKLIEMDYKRLNPFRKINLIRAIKERR